MCGTNVLDKDGISACVVLAELACYLAQNGMTLTQQLENIFDKYVQFYMFFVITLVFKIRQPFTKAVFAQIPAHIIFAAKNRKHKQERFWTKT